MRGPRLDALNEVPRDDFIKDSVAGVGRRDRVIGKAGIAFGLATPPEAVHRNIGTPAGTRVSPEGRIVGEAEWAASSSRAGSPTGSRRR